MKTSLKQTAMAVIISSILLASQANASGVPTVDGANLAQNVQQMVQDAVNHVETIDQWKKNFDQLKQQIDNQLAHLEAIKGARGIGKVEAIWDITQKAPDEWADIYATVGKLDPTGTLKDIKIDPNLQAKQAIAFQKQVDNDMQDIKKLFETLQDISRDVNAGKVKDAKDAADIANKIQLTTATINAIATRYDIMEKQLQQQEWLQGEKLDRRSDCIFKARGNQTERQKCLDN